MQDYSLELIDRILPGRAFEGAGGVPVASHRRRMLYAINCSMACGTKQDLLLDTV
jgi:hypothetical protein